MTTATPAYSKGNLTDALTKCAEEKKRSEKFTRDMVASLEQISNEASQSLAKAVIDLKSKPFTHQGTEEFLTRQLNSVKNDLERLPLKLYERIDILTRNDANFSITLFGKTMSGKSTLMETLTKGDGKTIGKGAQRTTRDIRDYYYKGLKITDVPGSGAFEGKIDEKTAMEAAKKSDLILFLITNNPPQKSEADCLEEIVNLGKPVICLINVKANIEDVNDEEEFAAFTDDLHEEFSETKISPLKRQLLEYSGKSGQDWSKIKFVCAHLNAAFMANKKGIRKEIKDKLYDLSKFYYLDKAIIKEVLDNGTFYKLKAYTDIVALGLIEALDTLFTQSGYNSKQGKLLIDEKRELMAWRREFKTEAENEIEIFSDRLKGDLEDEIDNFVINSYNNLTSSTIESEWRQIFANQDIEGQVSSLLEGFDNKCRRRIEETNRQLGAQVKYFRRNIPNAGNLGADTFTDWGSILSGAGAVGGSYFGPPGAFVGSLVGGFIGDLLNGFSDRDEAKQKLREQANMNVDKFIVKLKRTLLWQLRNEIIKERINPTLEILNNSTSTVFQLADDQREFAKKLNSKLQDLNMELVKKALAHEQLEELEYLIDKIARIPGNELVIVMIARNKFLPGRERIILEERLSALLQEKVRIISQKDNLKYMIDATMDEKGEIVIEKINEEPRIAHLRRGVDKDKLNRVRMAQQITELLIME